MSNEEIVSLLKEILKWTKFSGWNNLKNILETVLNDDRKKQVYFLTNGDNTTRQIESSIGVSRNTISVWWRDWAKIGIVEMVPSKGRGNRASALFSLDDFGIIIFSPSVLEKKEEKKIDE
jgi:Fic family protein